MNTEHHSSLIRLYGRMATRLFKRVTPLLITLLIAWSVGSIRLALAQSEQGPWTQSVNVSKSGAASQPVITIAPDGTLHALWWDAIEGEKYARGTSMTQTLWSKPVTVPAIVGRRSVSINPQTGKTVQSLAAPRQPRILSDARNNLYAFWFDLDNQLWGARALSGEWSGGAVLADSAMNMSIVADVTGTLHLAYLRTLNTPGNPSGIYYRTAARGTDWSVPTLVFSSLYFRSVEPDQANIAVAGDGQGNVIVVWDDLEQGQSLYSQSTNGGRTWSQPQPVGGSRTDLATRARVTATPQQDFIFLWQNSSAGDCGASQRRSTDGGHTWSTSERVLPGMKRCLDSWSFSFGEGGSLWLTGATAENPNDPSSGSLILTVWDGRAWSQSTEVNVNYSDVATRKSGGLGCLSLGLAGQTAGVIGCSPDGDVWTARNAVKLSELIPAITSSWSAREALLDLSDPNNVQGAPALAADAQGKVYAVLSLSANLDGPGTALYSAWWNGSNWVRAVPAILPYTGKADQPSLAIGRQGRMHLVWNGESNGNILYSWKYTRDAAAALAWSKPVELPAPTRIASWPGILADPRGDALHVIYAVPYNEERGIYYTRSNDGGTTWLTPTVIFNAVAAGWDSVDRPRLALDAWTGVLHAVWLRANVPGSANLQVVVYASSKDGGTTWSAPTEIAQGTVDWPQVAVPGAGQVQLVWNQVPSNSRGEDTPFGAWGQFSATGGEQWTEAARVSGFERLSGPVGLTGDSLVGIGQDTSGESILLYSLWDGRAWSAAERLALGRNAAAGNAASTVLIPGTERLMVALREYSMAADGTGYYDSRATSRGVANMLPLAPVPTLTPLPTRLPTVTATRLPTATARPSLTQSEAAQSTPDRPRQGQLPLVIGGVMAAVMVAAVVLGRVIRTAQR